MKAKVMRCFGRTTSCQCRCATMISFRCNLPSPRATTKCTRHWSRVLVGSRICHVAPDSTSSCNLLGAQPNARACHISLVKMSHGPGTSDFGRFLTGCPGPRSVNLVSSQVPLCSLGFGGSVFGERLAAFSVGRGM